MRASLFHDVLYQMMREGLLDRKVYRPLADSLFRKLCIEDGVNSFSAWLLWQGLKLLGEGATKKQDTLKGKIITI
jgi:hypothetical protein